MPKKNEFMNYKITAFDRGSKLFTKLKCRQLERPKPSHTFTIMSFFNVCLQVCCLWKWFATRITNVVFLAIMNCINVCLQVGCLWKAPHTLRPKYLFTEMYLPNMFSQVGYFCKWFSTSVTNLTFNCFQKFSSAWESFTQGF